jgi:hypothetical protein
MPVWRSVMVTGRRNREEKAGRKASPAGKKELRQ